MKFRVGDTVLVKQKGVIGYGETGTVVPATGELLPQFHEMTYNTVSVQLSKSGFIVKYSEDCVEKVGAWRSIDDAWDH